MFKERIYINRRKKLINKMSGGLILLLGNNESPINYPANTYFFRQDSTFLYYIGIDEPNLAAIIDIDENKVILFGNELTVEDIVWMGSQPSLKDKANSVGINDNLPTINLEEYIKNSLTKKRRIHFLPPYRTDKALWLESLLGIKVNKLKEYSSAELIKAVVEMRSIKQKEEIKEIESALQLTSILYNEAFKMAKSGVKELEISGRLEGMALEAGTHLSFPPIVTVHGETLHNNPSNTVLKKGNLLLVDLGVESAAHYSSDITRTFPVGGNFTSLQKDIYQTVIDMQQAAINAIKPGKLFLEIHLVAAKKMVENFKSMGFFNNNTDDIVSSGAYAILFPHGLGHMLGLDVHDMEDLGEDYVGYDDTVRRSNLFGLCYLRLAKKLQPGFVVTVEPGIYFIPELIEQWAQQQKYKDFIKYSKMKSFKNFGGIRIEDDVLVTKDTCKILSDNIKFKF